MAIINHVDTVPNADDNHCIGTTALTFKEGWFNCVLGTTCVDSPLYTNTACDRIFIQGASGLCVCQNGVGSAQIVGSILCGDTCVDSPIICSANFVCTECLMAGRWCNVGDMCTSGGDLCVLDGIGSFCDICGKDFYSDGTQLTASPWCENGAGALCQCTAACTLYYMCDFIACCNTCIGCCLDTACDATFRCATLWVCDEGALGCGIIYACGSVYSGGCLEVAYDGIFCCGNLYVCDGGTAGCGSIFTACNVCSCGCVHSCCCFAICNSAGVDTSWTNAQAQTVTVCGGIIVSVA